MIQEKTSEMMGGLQLPPGMKLPFNNQPSYEFNR